MTAHSAPDATIRVTAGKENLFSLHLSGRQVRTVRPIPIIDPGAAFDVLRRSISSEWSAVRRTSDPRLAAGKFRELASSGNATLLDLIAADPSDRRAVVGEIYDFFAEVDRKSSTLEAPRISVVSASPFPLDWLPVFGYGRYVVPDGPTLEQVNSAAIATFAGLRAAIHHFVPVEGSRWTPMHPGALVLEASIVDGRRRIRVAPYWHLDFGPRELAELSQIPPYQFDAPMPDDEMAERPGADRELATVIANGRPGGDEQIVFITAHGRTAMASGHDDALLFGRRALFRGGLEVMVLQRHLREWQPGATRKSPGPLSIVSACSAANISYENPTTIPDALREAGHRAVVAPLLAVDTDAARCFASALLSSLADQKELAVALMLARRAMPTRTVNLGAVMFACFGESRLRLDPSA
jgi:hypothetical protein